METTIVIKVKYGETLRRFNVFVNEGGNLDLGIDGLREKVLSLFNLAPDADLSLTYVDEDGDIVTLADEEDLCDVMKQSLNPLRITVKVNSEKGGRTYARSSGNSTPMRTPRVSPPFANLNSSVSEILKAVPEPIGEAFSKLSLDLASKAASSSPQLPELVQHFSKMLQSYVNLVGDSQGGTESSTYIGASEGTVQSSGTEELEASGDGSARPKVMTLVAKSEEQPAKIVNKVELANSTLGMKTSVTPASGSLGLNSDYPSDSFLVGSVPVTASTVPVPCNAVGDCKEEKKKSDECSTNTKAGKPAWENIKAVATSVFAADNNEVKKSAEGFTSFGTGASQVAPNTKTTKLGGGTSTGVNNENLVGECPFAGMPIANASSVPYTHYGPRVHPFKRSCSHGGIGGIFHRGVRCDGCGVHPITGPRFKSKVKEDYDLCSICFSEMGNESDYIRLDRPIPYRLPHLLMHPRVHPPTVPHALRGLMKPNRPKLDSRFIMDVNVVDGTMMTPVTPFTKIWRMRNNGTLVWPQGTQLVWIGGDRLSASLSVDLQISADGLPVENELEVAVDFTAPELPGRYISYWRMASPSGQKFGQRVWVLIQVDASLNDSLFDNLPGLNLNLPPVSSGVTGPDNSVAMDFESPAVNCNFPKPDSSIRGTELVEPLVERRLTNDQDLNFPINDSLLVNGGSVSAPPEAPTSVSYPTIDLSEVAPVVFPPVPSLSTDVQASAAETREKGDVEQTLLRELEEMGFKQVDLNKEILRMNEYDLEQSVDDLCGVSEWDPILEELQEMGFRDKEMNKKLLKKNNGSIKGVVMDLITGENA